MVARFVFGFLCFCSLLNVAQSCEKHCTEDTVLERVFKDNDVQGTIIISSLDGKNTFIHNCKRAYTRLSPASTFKIMNSIVALEEGVVRDQFVMDTWDGETRVLDTWNQDHNMKTAFRDSCIWFYQNIAKKVGKDTYRAYMKRADYGNQTPESDITRFWLADGELRITPMEQIQFLRNIIERNHGFSERTYDILKDIMLAAQGETYKIYRKTGAATVNSEGHGWYVGYIETDSGTWLFALNILMNGLQDYPLRDKVTLECLQAKGIIGDM